MAASDLFASAGDETFTRYRVEIQVLDKLIGGIPKDPDTIRKWLSARLEMGDRELIELARETAEAMESTSGERPSADDLTEAVAREIEGGNGFKTVNGQLVYEGRCMKAALKEAANVAYPGTAWPGKPTGMKKGLMRRLAETVFVDDQHITLGVEFPSGTEQRIKHIMTPQGPRSAINVVDFVEKPRLSFTVAVLDDFLPNEAWLRIWQCAEEIGIGADRARSDGKFELLAWDRI
jgi:hypothetical protein